MRRSAGRNLRVAADGEPPPPRTRPQNTPTSTPGRDRPPAQAGRAAEELEAARAAVADANSALRIVEAKYAEALDAAPDVSPAVARAEKELVRARDDAQKAAVAVAEAERARDDAAGTVRATQAAVDDLDPNTARHTVVAAEERAAKAVRAARAAEDVLIRAQERHEEANTRLAGAEESLQHRRAQPAREPAAVIAAQEAIYRAERARDATEHRLAALEAAIAAAGDADEAATPVFASVAVFVEQYVLPNWRHLASRTNRWCRGWWLHEEAVTRLEALWEAFEALRREPAPALSTWIRDHLDHHMAMLTREDGPFAQCNAGGEHQAQPLLPVTEPPPGLFESDPASPVQPRRRTDDGGVA